MILRLAFGRLGRASRLRFLTDFRGFLGTPMRLKCMVSSASRPISRIQTPGTVEYSAFVWDPARETWDEAPFPVPPVVGFQCSHIDGHLIACGKHPSEQERIDDC